MLTIEINLTDQCAESGRYTEVLRELAQGLDAGHYGGSGTYYVEDSSGKRHGTITINYGA